MSYGRPETIICFLTRCQYNILLLMVAPVYLIWILFIEKDYKRIPNILAEKSEKEDELRSPFSQISQISQSFPFFSSLSLCPPKLYER